MEKTFQKLYEAQLKESKGLPTFVDKDSFDPSTLENANEEDLEKYDKAAQYQDFKVKRDLLNLR